MVSAISGSKYRELLARARIIFRELNQKCRNNLGQTEEVVEPEGRDEQPKFCVIYISAEQRRRYESTPRI